MVADHDDERGGQGRLPRRSVATSAPNAATAPAVGQHLDRLPSKQVESRLLAQATTNWATGR